MSQPQITAKEVEAAAVVLEKMSSLYGMDKQLGEWCASDLRAEMSHITALEGQQVLREEAAGRVSQKVAYGLDVHTAVRVALEQYELARVED